MEVWEKIVEYTRRGFEVWDEDEEKVRLGKVLFEDCYGECQDWEEVIIFKDTGEVTRKYGTNRVVPGWEMDENTGEWRKVYY